MSKMSSLFGIKDPPKLDTSLQKKQLEKIEEKEGKEEGVAATRRRILAAKETPGGVTLAKTGFRGVTDKLGGGTKA